MLPAMLQASESGLAFGMGRSYGDSCLNPGGILWKTTRLDRFISFDDVTGLLHCESGVLVRDIQQTFIPRGWTLAVVPGTQLVTVGGAIANDIHGKNHHRQGSFGDHVQELSLLRTDGSVIECAPTLNSNWFAATVGGLGLTGVIATAKLQLRRVPGPWLQTQSIPFSSLEEFFFLSDESEADWEYAVSWIDCLSRGSHRGLFMRANAVDIGLQSAPDGRVKSMPFTPPFSLVNRLSLRPFNAAYFNVNKRKIGFRTQHYETFFHPLDNLHHWNRMYGPKGFYQYQSVVPSEAARDATGEMLNAIAKSGEGSFLAVLKTFGNRRSLGMLSFPKPGTTLALDFPNRGNRTVKLFNRLDAIVCKAGGRIYPAKDARMPRAMFESGYPRLTEFLPFRDPGISSAMSRRLMGS
jgi:FAD/FMN-containing dehydrogenase